MFGIESFLQTRSATFIERGQLINLSVGAIVLIATVFSVSRNRSALSKPNLVQVLSLTLFAYGFFSYVWTPVPNVFRSRWFGSVPYLGLFLVMGPVIAQERGAIRDGLRWTLYMGVPLVLLAIFYCEWGSRGMILAAPMKQGNYLVYETLPLALASFSSYVGVIALVTHTKLPLATLIRMVILGLAVYIAFLTRSRGQVVAIIAVAATVYPLSNRIGSVKGVAISAVGLGGLAWFIFKIASQLDLARWRSDRIESAIDGRQAMWWQMLETWASTNDIRWVTGLGAMASFKHVGFYPHNLPVEILTELGFIGFVLFFAIVWLSVVNGINILSRLDKYPEIRGEILVLLGLLAISLLLCLKEGSLYTWPILFFFAICLSQLESKTRKSLSGKRWRMSNYFWPEQTSAAQRQTIR